jgi:hypothetical protein
MYSRPNLIMLSPNCLRYLQAKQYSCERLDLLLEGLEPLLEVKNRGINNEPNF